MKGVEVVGLGYFMICIVKCLQIMSFFQYFEYMSSVFPDCQDYFRPGLVDEKIISEWAGTSREFLEIEILLFFSFSFTVVILLMRARYQPVGTDNTQ